MSDQSVDVIVVGGGVMGSAAAYHLAKDGRRVLLLEQFPSGHNYGSSHGPSRIIRLAYDIPDYVALARSAYELWHTLEEDTGERLLVQTGGLDMGVSNALALEGIRETFDATGVAYEQLDRDEIMRRFPQFDLPEETMGIYQPDYSVLAADRCVAAMATQAQQRGALIRTGEAARAVRVTPGGGVEVQTDAGTYTAERVILSAGSWMRPLLHQLDLDLPLTVLKEQLAFFEAHDPEAFKPGRFPLVIHRFPGTTSLGSVFPIFNHTGVKVMIDRVGPEVEPDDTNRAVDQTLLEELRIYAQSLMPGLTGEISEAVTCRYTMTPDEDFIIDTHPAFPQVIVASPCSGHGFKFGVVIGRILADLATQGTTAHNIERFRIDRPALNVQGYSRFQ